MGGQDIDNALVDYMIEKIKEDYQDFKPNKKVTMKIKKACCEAKKLLSFNFDTCIIIESCVGDEDFNYDLTRTEFEKICKPIFDRCFPPVEKALAES